MMTKKKKRLLIILIIVAIVVILSASLLLIYLKTDKLKSSKTLFFKYLGENTKNIEELQSIQFLPQNPDTFSKTTTAKANYTTNLGTTSEDTSNGINQLTLQIDEQKDSNSQYDYRKIQLLKGENQNTSSTNGTETNASNTNSTDANASNTNGTEANSTNQSGTTNASQNVSDSNSTNTTSQDASNANQNTAETNQNEADANNTNQDNANQNNSNTNGGQDNTNNKQNNASPVATIETLQNGGTSGIRFTDSFSQYLTDNNTDFKSLLEKIGVTNDDVKNAMSLGNLENLNLDDIKFTSEELQSLKKKYTNVASQNITSASYSKKPNTSVQIDGTPYYTNSYTVTMTKEQLNNLYVKILEQVEQDEIILGKIDKIQEKINSVTGSQGGTLRNDFVNKIEAKINEIKSTSIGTDETTITVYENQKSTIRTAIKTNEYEIDIDYTDLDGERYFDISKHIQEKTKNQSLTVKATSEKVSVSYEDEENGADVKTASIERDGSNQESSGKNKYSVKYQDQKQKVELNVNQSSNQTNAEKTSFNDENSADLSKLNDDQIKMIQERVSTAVNEEVDKVSQDIKRDDIITMLKNIGLMYEDSIDPGTGVSDSEKDRYNLKYQILEGENQEGENVLNSLETIKDDISNLQVVSSNELKIEIKRNGKNDQMVKSLETFFTENKNDKYNIKAEYDDAGFINKIDITIVPKE